MPILGLRPPPSPTGIRRPALSSGGDQRLLNLARESAEQRSARTSGGLSSLYSAPVDYADEYRKSSDAARAGISKQFEIALGDIAAREGAAGAAVGQLPGQLQAIYGQSGETLNQATQALQAAQASSGLTSFMTAQDQMAPLQSAIGADQAARMADVPLLQLAMQTEFSRQRAGARSGRADAETSMAADQADFARQMQAAELERRQRLADVASERQYADRTRRQDQAFQMRLRDLDTQTALASERDADTGMSIGEMEAVRASAPYRYAVNLVKEGAFKDGKKKKLSPQEVIDRYSGNPALQKVLIADLLGPSMLLAGLTG